MTYNPGENPGKGIYQCVYSGDIVCLIEDSEKLPLCDSKDCLRIHPDTKWRRVD